MYGVFHIARVMGFTLMRDRWGHGNIQAVERVLKTFKPVQVENAYVDAVAVIVELRRQDEKTHSVPAMYFKNSISQKKLNAKLRAN